MAYYEVAMKVRQKNRADLIMAYSDVATKVRQKNRGELTSWPTMRWT